MERHQSKADPTQFMFYEQWDSKADLAAHGKTPHIRPWVGSSRTRQIKGRGRLL
ncbi:MAG: putative quinol monooxygenase [Isosphaeraceae bacterium]